MVHLEERCVLLPGSVLEIQGPQPTVLGVSEGALHVERCALARGIDI